MTEDIRCKYCNWLNKEVKENFICLNCKKENINKKEVDIDIDKRRYDRNGNKIHR